MPSVDASGRQRLSNPPLALDLHYLLSAYGAEDLHAEILLGYAMQLLHETPVLGRDAIETALNPSPNVGADLPPALRALADAGLADQVEQIKITPSSMNSEEMSRLWAALQAHYRPTATYRVSVVLIESRRPTRAPLPVLSRGPVDPVTQRERGVVVVPSLLPPLPTIEAVQPAAGQPVAQLGAGVAVSGHHLDGTNRTVVLANARFDIEQEVAAAAGGGGALLQFTLPNAPADWPVGVYLLAVRLVRPGETLPRTSNRLPLAIAPEITTPLPASVARDAQGVAEITVNCRPEVRPGQQASLLLGQQEVAAEPFTTATATLTFRFNDPPVNTPLLVRLRVDGIDSPIIDRTATPPVFFNRRITVT